MVDFLFVYEVKNRELENICLLKNELENRGYTVKLVETWYSLLYYVPRIEAKVVVAFALYNNGVVGYVSSFSRNVTKIVNLQWEQVFAVGDEESSECLFNIVNYAKQAVHISWGEFNYRRLTEENGLSKDHVFDCGHIALDFYKPLLKDYYLSREELCKKYGLDNKKKIHLFISSFSLCDMPDRELTQGVYTELSYDLLEFKRLAKKSQDEILKWYETLSKAYPEIQFVYRIHPAEVGNKKLDKLSETHKNFLAIGGESVKQWILVADTITNWYSTSMTEIFVAKKNCAILRPVDIPEKMDIRMFLGCQAIKTFDEFSRFIVEDLKGQEIPFPVNEKIVRSYYTIDDNYSFKKICDVLERVKDEDIYRFDFESVVKSSICNGYLKRIKLFIIRTIVKIALLLPFMCKIKIIERVVFYYKMIKKNYSTDKEIDDICNRLREVIKANS